MFLMKKRINLIWTGQRINKAFGFVKATPAAGITLKDAGNYLVYVNIPLEGSVARGSVGLAVSLDDEIVDGARGQQGYIATQMAIGSLQSTFQASLTPPQVRC